ncbi:MAG: cysteine hydrolase [Deltaproteobacteria bacterium]|nr:cysteine hydrolase [Deltaproteobacteria bacterium]MBF0526999.1 cysteine hydrolase [Deltaproteobacteria bacterium]
MNTALLLVDIQQDYFPGGRMELVGSTAASDVARRLLMTFREKNLPIIHVQHISTREGATFFLPNTEGINFHQNVTPLPDETIVKKHYPNSFRETDLDSTLVSMDIHDVTICGMMSHMCIDATVRAAFDAGYRCTIAHDACATRNLTFNGVDVPAEYVQAGFMAALGSVYAQVLAGEALIDGLAG